jgi:predicted AAA+ superfamily ATPase
VTNTPLPAALHERAADLYKLYLIIGGLPLAIEEYLQNGSLLPVADTQIKIVNDYLADMAKGASPAESAKMRAAYNSIPLQLAKEDKKFQYRLAQKGGTAAIFGPALNWLTGAGIVLKCGRITEGLMPLAVYGDPDSFKLYMADTGLLTMKSGISRQTVLGPREADNVFLSALNENYVAQALAAKQYGLYYWTSEGRAEVDFVLQQGYKIIAVELKTSLRGQSKSLAMFAQKYRPAYAIRISGKNFGIENNIKSLPYYAVFCI